MAWVRIAVIALVTFMLGGLWYSPAGFLKIWARENGHDFGTLKEKHKTKHPAIVFGLSYVAAVLATYALSRFVGPDATWLTGLQVGALAGGLFVATSFAINYSFAGRTLKLWLVDAGYHVVQFALMGLLLGLWR
jgi:hypothetical protein